MEDYVYIGKIVNTHGIKGEVKIYSESDFDDIRYKKGNTVYIFKDGEMVPYECATYRRIKDMPVVSFKGYPNINLILDCKGCEVYIAKKDQKPLKKGEYYRNQISGLEVYDEEDNYIGTIKEVEETQGAQNNIRIQTAKKDVLVPFVPHFIKEVDLDHNKLVIHKEEGLF